MPLHLLLNRFCDFFREKCSKVSFQHFLKIQLPHKWILKLFHLYAWNCPLVIWPRGPGGLFEVICSTSAWEGGFVCSSHSLTAQLCTLLMGKARQSVQGAFHCTGRKNISQNISVKLIWPSYWITEWTNINQGWQGWVSLLRALKIIIYHPLTI